MEGNNGMKAGYKMTEVGVIPGDWEVKKLKELSTVKTGPFGSALHEKDYVQDGTPIITVEHLGEQGVIHANLPMVSAFDKKRLNSYELKVGDIVFSRVGSVDRNSLIRQGENGWLFSGRLLRIRLNIGNANAAYFSYYFHQEAFKQRIRSVAVGQTMASLNTRILNEIEVAFPSSIVEQTAIATALSDADALLATLDRLISKKRQIKQGAMQLLLTGKKRLAGFEGEWEVKRLGEIGEKFLNGGTPSTQIFEYWKGNIPWITGADVIAQKVTEVRRFITMEAVKNSSTNIVQAGNLLIVTRTGVGKLAMAPYDLAISQDLTGVYVKKELALLEFLFFFFDYHSSNLKELNQGTSIAGITRETLLSTQTNLPPLPEQTAIAHLLTDMDAEIESLERKRAKYQAIKQGMMQELLTGKVRLVATG